MRKKKEPLKVGDRVSWEEVYDTHVNGSEMKARMYSKRFIGKLNTISDDGSAAYVVAENVLRMTWVSLKVLRRLKPKAKPREFWIPKHPEYFEDQMVDLDWLQAEPSEVVKVGFIHVREVKK